MLRLTPATRLSLGLVILTISLLLLAEGIGLAPDGKQQQLNSRSNLVEMLATQFSFAIQRGDGYLLRTYMNQAVELYPDLLSVQ